MTGLRGLYVGGCTFDIGESKWKFADTDASGNTIDGKKLLEEVVYTTLYSITQDTDESSDYYGYYTLTATDLVSAFEDVKSLDSSDYTASSWKEVQDLYDTAYNWTNDEVTNGTVTEDMIKEQAAKIEAAIAALVKGPSDEDTEAAEKAVEEAAALNASDYTPASYQAVTDAAAAVTAAIEGKDTSADDFAKLVETLNAAVKNLVKAPGTQTTAAADQAIADAKALNSSDYTADSYQKVTDALNALETLKNDKNASADDLEKAVEALNTAIKGLVKAEASSTDTETAVVKGKTYKVGVYKYKATSATTVTLVGMTNKKATKANVAATVKINGTKCKVTAIAANAFKNMKKLKSVTVGKNVKTIGKKAFYNCKKLKKITIKSTVLKKVGKKALSGINKKAVIKVPKKKLAAYKKLLKNKGQKKTVKIKK